MRRIAYLVNRYPEASLAAITREVRAVAALGHEVLRFAHRPSVQPLLAGPDAAEAALTTYLASGDRLALIASAVRAASSRPRQLVNAIRQLFLFRAAGPVHVGHLFIACRLAALLKRARVDHLHVHFAMTSGAVASLTRCLGGPPWSVSVHGPEEFDRSREALFRMLVRSADITIAVSDWARSFVSRAAAADGRTPNHRVIHLGVDDLFLSDPSPMDPAGPALCIARLESRKGHCHLLDAVETVKRRHPLFRVELIGDGPMRPELESCVLSRGLSDNVILSGWKSQEQVRDRLDRCRFVVLPSLAEGLPVALMEAFARGRPVVATDVGGVAELVRHRVNGLVVPPGDSKQLADALLELAGAPTLRLEAMGVRGRALVEAEYMSAGNARILAATWAECRN